MKIKLIMLFIIFSSLLYAEDTATVPVDENQSIEELLNTNRVGFDFIVDGRSAKAYLICDKGKFECGFIGSWQTYVFQRVEYVNAELCNVYFMVSTEIFDTPDYNFDKLEAGYSGYTHWDFPYGYRTTLTKAVVLDYIHNERGLKVFYNSDERYPSQC